MATPSLSCPQCHSVLRSSRPVAADAMIRCPQCGNHFPATPSPAVPGVPVALAPAAWHPLLLLLPAVVAALVLGVVSVAGVVWVIRQRPPVPPPSLVDAERERRLEAEQKRLQAQKQELDAERDRLAEQKQRQEYTHLLDEGGKFLIDKRFEDAQKSYEAALKLYPGDANAVNGLVASRAGAATAAQLGEDKDKRRADYERLFDQGQQALKAKQFAVAARLFESALQFLPGDAAGIKALADAQEALVRDQAEKKAKADYETFMEAGRAAVLAGRYTDAIREYLAAQRVVPGDAAALQGQRQAELRIADLQDREKRVADFNRLTERARTALRAKSYDEALDLAQAALRLFPKEAAAQKLLEDVKSARHAAREDYRQLIARADSAFAAQRYEAAYRLYSEALQVLPDDPAAAQGQRAASRMIQDFQAGQAAYVRFMAVGAAAMKARRFADAIAAYSEALRLLPGDVEATAQLLKAKNLLDLEAQRKVDFDRQIQLGRDALAKKQYADAVAAYKEALRLLPDQPQAVAGLRQARYGRAMEEGSKALNAKQYADAVQFFGDALREKPGDANATNLLRAAKTLTKK